MGGKTISRRSPRVDPITTPPKGYSAPSSRPTIARPIASPTFM